MKQPFSKFFSKNEKVEEVLDSEKAAQEVVENLPIANIVPNQYQPRSIFDEDKIDELSQTIKTHGIIQPIVVRKRQEQYEIIAGERRWRAVSKLGWETIPAVIKDFDDKKTASIALIENLQREGLTSIEEAVAYAKLLDLHGLTQESLAQRLGKSQSTVANKLRLLQLPEKVKEALLNRQITERHARALVSLKESTKQEEAVLKIIDDALNVKQTELFVASLMNTKTKEPKKDKPKKIRKSVSKDTRLAMNTIRKSVDMVTQTGLVIDSSEEEHEEFYQITIRIPK